MEVEFWTNKFWSILLKLKKWFKMQTIVEFRWSGNVKLFSLSIEIV